MQYLLWHTVDNSAEARPDSIACRFADRQLTYRELAEQTNCLARTLIALGVSPGDRVGILLPKSLEAPIAAHGIMKAGAAFVPIDAQAPPERVNHILNDCGIGVLISEDSRARVLARCRMEDTPLHSIIGLERALDQPVQSLSWTDVAAAETHAPAVDVTEMDLAYIMYTSGSTGQPKGLMHTHRSGLSYAELSAAAYGLTERDRVSSFPPLHVDQCTFALFSAPLAGATSIVVSDECTAFPIELARLIERERITVWYSVPLALIQLLERGELHDFDHRSLRWVTYGGEPFAPAQLRALMSHWPQARFSNVYGPAEVNQCTYYHFTRDDLVDDRAVPIGLVWGNTKGLVVDDNDDEVEDGIVGEFLIRSPTMMAGYWQRPDLNSQAFYERDETGGIRSRYYRTGDLVRRREDGLLEFLGRKDRQVKIRGQRVELEEVEAVLCRQEAVREAVAYVIGASSDDRRIAAAVLLQSEEQTDEKQILRHASRFLAASAVPQELTIEESFPRTSAGKVDRRALALRLGGQPS